MRGRGGARGRGAISRSSSSGCCGRCSAWRVELLGLAVLVGVERLLAGVVGEAPRSRSWSSWSAAALAWRPVRRSGAAAAARDARAAGVGACGDRRGRRAGSVPLSGRVVGGSRAGGRSCCGFGCGAGSRCRARCAPRAAGRVPSRARGPRAARSAGRGARPTCCWSGAIRSRTRRRCLAGRRRGARCRCGSRSRSASTSRASAVAIELVERNVLIGGEPGAGKSVALSTLVAAAALDPDARIWLLDGKLVELAAWAPVARAGRRPERRGGARAAARGAGGDGRALSRAARARAAEGPPRGRAAAAPGGLRRARVLSDAAGQGGSARSSPSCCATWSRAAARPA